MKNVIIIGAGGFGREVYWWAKHSLQISEYRFKGFLDDKLFEDSKFTFELPVIATIDNYIVEENDVFIIAIGNVSIKKNTVNSMKERGANFLTLIHPTAIVVPTAKIGEGVILAPYTLISDSAVLGDFVMMNIYSSVGHDVTVGEYSVFGPYATAGGGSVMSEGVFLAAHSLVVPYKNIGTNVQISANCTAFKNVDDKALVYSKANNIFKNFS